MNKEKTIRGKKKISVGRVQKKQTKPNKQN